MRLRKRDLMRAYREQKGLSQAGLGRYATCSRQFIWQLESGERNTCTKDIAKLIEEALGLIPGTLFEPNESTATGLKSSAAGPKKAA
ncbi:MAG TPA: helix-turn-helix transcriptional regulator [Mycobacterium sp.]|jgi:transcriptional regulator with XRE-family HTH domain|uniref:helix-turn-helix transcriptional regulator n=1 Tax=Mycobacterium sp. TaxID=1785 RepID=UPI002F40650C